MSQSSFALMTNLGRAKEAAALANATTIQITHIAIGDGNTVPSGGETTLYHEIVRKTVVAHGTVVGSSNVAYFDAFLAAGDGPFTIREAGLIDSAGDLIAIARYDPPINKPVPLSGQVVEGTIRLEVAFSDVANVTIVVDPAMKVPLQRLTVLPWIPVLSMNTAVPPVAPALGDTYVVPAGATGAWAGQANMVAEYTQAGWSLSNGPNGHGISLPGGRVFEKVAGVYVEKLALDSQSGKWVYAAAAGTPNALTIGLNPPPAANLAGMMVKVLIGNPNTGPATLNVGPGALPIRTMQGFNLRSGDLIPGAIMEFVCTGAAWLIGNLSLGEVTQPVYGNLTFFLRHDGDDNNTGLANTAAAAWKTTQGAIDNICRKYAANRFTATVNMNAAGAFYAGYSAYRTPMRIVFAGVAGAPAQVVISDATAGSLIAANYFSDIGLKDLTVHNTQLGSGTGVGGDGNSMMTFENINWGGAATYNLAVQGGANAILIGNHLVLGTTRAAVFRAQVGGRIGRAGVLNIDHQPSVNVTDAYVSAASGLIYLGGTTFLNKSNVTGKRYSSEENAVISSGAGGPNFFPGTVAGTAATGGIF